MFCILDCTSELFLILQPLQRPICFQVPTTTIILPTLGVFGDVDGFCIFFPSNFNCFSKFVNSLVKTNNVQYNRSANTPKQRCKIFDKWYFLIAVFDYRLLTSVDILLHNRNSDSKRHMIERKPPIGMNQIIIQLIWATLKKHEIDDQVWVMFIIWISRWHLISRNWKF